MMNEDVVNGWAVAVIAIRYEEHEVKYWLRCFTVGVYDEKEARSYAHDQVAVDYPPADGWEITTATQLISGVRELVKEEANQ